MNVGTELTIAINGNAQRFHVTMVIGDAFEVALAGTRRCGVGILDHIGGDVWTLDRDNRVEIVTVEVH